MIKKQSQMDICSQSPKKIIHVLQPDACKFLSYIESSTVKESFTVTKGDTINPDCDALFCQTYTHPEMVDQLAATKKDVILHVNGDVWYEMRHIHKNFKLLRIINEICEKAAAIICLSKFLAGKGLDDVASGNFMYLPKGLWGVSHTPNGVDPKRFQLKRSFNAKTPLVISQIGFSLPWKFNGIPVFFDAIRKLSHQARFVNVGWKNGYEDLVAEWEKKYDITFIDPVPDWPSFLHTADFYIQPSLYDTWGRSVAEAMCCGLPVIAYDAGGVPELSEKIIFCDPQDGVSTARTFSDLITHPERWPEIGKSLYAEAQRLDFVHRNDYRDLLKEILFK